MTVTGHKRTLRIWQVKEKTGLSEATVWRLSASGEFPKPIKLSKGCTVWLEQEIDELLDAKAANRERDTANRMTPPKKEASRFTDPS
jgi:prophage regulatory protein